MWVDPLGCCDSLVPSKLWIVQWSPCVSPPGHPQKTSPPKLTQPLLEVSAVTDLNVIRGWFCDTFVVAASAQSNTQNLTIHGLCFLWQLQRYQMAYSEKTWISHWMDIAVDHWKDQDQIRFHLRRKTRPWSSSIRPTHLILVTDNFIELIFRFSNGPVISLCLVLNQNHWNPVFTVYIYLCFHKTWILVVKNPSIIKTLVLDCYFVVEICWTIFIHFCPEAISYILSVPNLSTGP